jgi:hypothetical protein
MSFKSLVAKKKDHLFKIQGMEEPVRVDKIKNGKVFFYGETDQAKQKGGEFKVDYFLKIIEEVFKPRPRGADDQGPAISIDMITKGFRYKLKIDAPEYEVTKINKSLVTVAYVKDLADPERRKEPGIYETFKPIEFLAMVNEAHGRIAAASKKAPGVKKPKKRDEELTIKKTTDKLPIDLSADQVNGYAIEASGIQKQINDKEQEKKAFVSQIGGEIKELTAKRDAIQNKVLTKKEYVDVAVHIEYHWKRNEKIVRRMDTKGVVKKSAIPKSELEQSFIE